MCVCMARRSEVAKTVGHPDGAGSLRSLVCLFRRGTPLRLQALRQDTEVVGVVFNRVAPENHYRFLREAAEDAGVIPLGYIPKTSSSKCHRAILGSHSASCRSWMHSPKMWQRSSRSMSM